MINHDFGISLGDVPAQARDWRNLSEIRDWCRENDHIHPEQQAKWFANIQTDENNRMYGIYILPESFPKEPTTFQTSPKIMTTIFPKKITAIGVCGLTNINWKHRTGEWSLYIVPEHRGKGYAKAALRTLIQHGFESLNLHRIWGEIFEHNTATRNIAKSLGFIEEGHLHDTYYKSGKYINSVIVGLLRKDWKDEDKKETETN